LAFFSQILFTKNNRRSCAAQKRSGIEQETLGTLAADIFIASEVMKMPRKYELNEIDLRSCDRAEPVEIWKARKLIEERSSEELPLTRIARSVNISANYLSEKFKQVTGTTFVSYLTHVRVERACRLLRDSNEHVSEIAFAVGFQSLSQFNRAFKKLTGKSPTSYRRVQRKRGR
jgi:AraC-like DNA-binding protein